MGKIILILALITALAIPTQTHAQTNIENLAIYYGWPSEVNGANGDINKAIAAFQPYQVIVFGDGIEHASHGDHNNTQKVINGLKSTGNKIFGYVPIGTNSSNLPIATIEQDISEWKAMGVYGVFLDEYGFDYGVTRDKQNQIVSYAHSKGLKVFANAWTPSDAMGDKNEKGQVEKTLLGSGDYYLMEDWIANQGKLGPAKNWVSKADSALSLSKTTGVNIAVLATNPNPYKNNVNYYQFIMAEYATAMYGFQAFEWQENDYSSNSNKISYYPLPHYEGSYTQSSVTHNSEYSIITRTLTTGTFTITQNGTFSGKGVFFPN